MNLFVCFWEQVLSLHMPLLFLTHLNFLWVIAWGIAFARLINQIVANKQQEHIAEGPAEGQSRIIFFWDEFVDLFVKSTVT